MWPLMPVFVGLVGAGVGSWLVLSSWEGEEEDPQLLGKVCSSVPHQAGYYLGPQPAASQSIAGRGIPINGCAVGLSAVSPDLLPPLDSCECQDSVALPLPQHPPEYFQQPRASDPSQLSQGTPFSSNVPCKSAFAPPAPAKGHARNTPPSESVWTDTLELVLPFLMHSWHRIRSFSV